MPVFPGGLAILNAVLSELDIERMVTAGGAMRQGVLYDLLGRFHHQDMRDVTVAQFMQRYHVDALQARRVGDARLLALPQAHRRTAGEPDEAAAQRIAWAAKLHEIGISVAYSGYHKHSAYIIDNADMPGFSNDEQRALVAARARPPPLAQEGRQAHGRARRGLEHGVRAAARRAVLPQPGRHRAAQPAGQAARARSSGSAVDSDWLARNPLTATALHEEVREWDKIGFELKVPGLEEFETGTELRRVEPGPRPGPGRSRRALTVAVAAREPPERAFLAGPSPRPSRSARAQSSDPA